MALLQYRFFIFSIQIQREHPTDLADIVITDSKALMLKPCLDHMIHDIGMIKSTFDKIAVNVSFLIHHIRIAYQIQSLLFLTMLLQILCKEIQNLLICIIHQKASLGIEISIDLHNRDRSQWCSTNKLSVFFYTDIFHSPSIMKLYLHRFDCIHKVTIRVHSLKCIVFLLAQLTKFQHNFLLTFIHTLLLYPIE